MSLRGATPLGLFSAEGGLGRAKGVPPQNAFGMGPLCARRACAQEF